VRPIRGIAVTAALALGALALAGAATATGNGTRAYEFVGTVQAVDVPGNHVSVAVSGGNRAALRAMIGQPATETFTVGPGTRFAWWGSVRFAPPAGLASLQSGQRVRVLVQAPKDAPLATIGATPARRVAVTRPQILPHSREWLFVGSCRSASPASVALDVTGGNWLALWKMLGQPIAQTFPVGPNTLLISRQSGHPTAVTGAQLAGLCAPGNPNANVVVRLFAPRTWTLAQALAAPTVVRIAFHTPAAGQHP
jgi:hypothetical protein